MSDDPDKKDDPETREDPAAELRQGLSHLWKAARVVASGVKKEVERTDLGKAIDDASREFVRAAANVVDRIAHEVDEIAKPGKRPDEPPPPPEGAAPTKPEGEGDDDEEFDGVRPKEKGASPQDPGFRIAPVDDDPEKKKPE